jgi:hypothetical protein
MVAGGLIAATVLSACSSNSSTGPTTTTTTTSRAPVSTVPAGAITTTAPASTTATTRPTPTLPMQTATGGEFLSPTGNISCEIDDGSPNRSVLCESLSPPQSVTMTPSGALTKCSGPQCSSNPGEDTPTLAYGTATGVGPFRCLSATTGMTCTVTGGKGFQISSGGIIQLG